MFQSTTSFCGLAYFDTRIVPISRHSFQPLSTVNELFLLTFHPRFENRE